MQKRIHGRQWLFFTLTLLLIGCSAQFPRGPYREEVNESIIGEKRIPIPQFFEIDRIEFSPDKSKVAITGVPKEYDDGETEPEFMFLPTSTLIVLEWPSLTELYRYDPAEPGPDGYTDVRTVRWSPDGNSVYVIHTQSVEDGRRRERFLARIDFATKKVTNIPFEPWDFIVSPDSNEIVAWGDYAGNRGWGWLWSNELFVYDAHDLTIMETIVVPEIAQIGLVFPDKYPDQLLLIAPANCRYLNLNSTNNNSMAVPSVASCDNTAYRFQMDNHGLELLFEDPFGDVLMFDRVELYNPERGMLIARDQDDPTIYSFIDVEQKCVVFELSPWSNYPDWYDDEHVFTRTLPTQENRIPEIRLYRLQELMVESPSSCPGQSYVLC